MSTKKADHGEKPSTRGGSGDVRKKGLSQVLAKSAAVNYAISILYRPGIASGSIEYFKDPPTGKYLQLTYGKKVDMQEWHPEKCGDAENSVKVARWFLQKKGAFGTYNAFHWNCEHFATFCKTTTLTEDELQQEWEDEKARAGASWGGELDREFLKARSKARSTQTW